MVPIFLLAVPIENLCILAAPEANPKFARARDSSCVLMWNFTDLELKTYFFEINTLKPVFFPNL